MTNDMFLVTGILTLVMAIPSVMSAFSDGRAPRAAAILVMIGGGLVALAVNNQPGGYTLNDVPHAFVRVIGSFL